MRASPLRLAIQGYLAHQTRRGLAAGSIRGTAHALAHLERFCRARGLADALALTPARLDTFARHLARVRPRWPRGRKRLARITQVQIVRAVRAFLAHLVREGELLLDPGVHLVRRDPRTVAADRAVRPADVAAMVAAIAGDAPLDVRARAIVEVFFGCGLRRAEVAALDTADIDLRGGTLFVRRGKGGKDRVVPLAGQARCALRLYLTCVRPELVSGQSGPALFLASGGHRLGAHSLGRIVAQAAERAGLARRVTPHRLRHGFATALLAGGAGIRFVQVLLGHACLDTTQRYTAVDLADLRQVHRRTHPRERCP